MSPRGWEHGCQPVCAYRLKPGCVAFLVKPCLCVIALCQFIHVSGSRAPLFLELANSFHLGWIRHRYSALYTGIMGYLCVAWDALHILESFGVFSEACCFLVISLLIFVMWFFIYFPITNRFCFWSYLWYAAFISWLPATLNPHCKVPSWKSHLVITLKNKRLVSWGQLHIAGGV